MKKVLYGIYIFLFIFFFHLAFRFTINEIYIGRYNDGNYTNNIVNFLHFLNYPESYIAHYNKGNNLYQTGDYEGAIEEYQEALKSVKGNRRCQVEINYAFAKLETVIDKKNNTADVKDLRDIQAILLDSDCATKDNKGKSKDAQTLYNELEEIIKNANGGGGGTGDDQPNDQPNDQPEDYSELEQLLQQQQQQAFDDRNENLNPRDYEYYSGKNW